MHTPMRMQTPRTLLHKFYREILAGPWKPPEPSNQAAANPPTKLPCRLANHITFVPPGKTSVVMIGGRPGRVAETNFGSYLADIMVSRMKRPCA
jgi:hypothetical protein